jgi:anti-sigma factor RsiW
MKPCSNNRKQLAWLAANSLDEKEASELRAHVKTCAGCREYFAEMTNITRDLAAPKITPEIQTSESFHQRVVRSVLAEKSTPFGESVMAFLRATMLNWRMAVPAVAAIMVVAAIGWHGSRLSHPDPAIVTQHVAQVAPPRRTEDDLSPTFSNYRMAANRSLESFDELLARQSRRNLPSAPVYTASTLDGGDGVN